MPAEQIDLPSPFDARAIAVVQGAIAQGILAPPTATNLDMRKMPPNLAQAYLFTALSAVDSARVANRWVQHLDGRPCPAALCRVRLGNGLHGISLHLLCHLILLVPAEMC